jgi:dTDP-L-rhamnose 4-epimerase
MDSPYSGVAAIFRSQLESGQAPSVFEDGQQMRDFIHVSDVARANRIALESLSQAPVGGLPLNVCSGQPRSVGWAAQVLADELDGPSPRITGQFRAADVRHVVASPSLAGDLIGFRAQINPEQGFRQFARDPMRTTKVSQ